MKLPNVTHAVIEIEKLRDYCLSETHPRGKHKARVFATTLGLTARNALELRDAISTAIQTEAAVVAGQDNYGQRYSVDFSMNRRGRNAPRLTSCYVL